MNKIRYIVLWLVLLLLLVLTNWSIFRNEQLLANGQVVLLELAPVDPRSLFQGDYMALRYALTNEVTPSDWPIRGTIVVQLDDNGVATFHRLHNPAQSLAANELLLEYHIQSNSFDWRGDTIFIGVESFFFQEGHAEFYEAAEYGELRVDSTGKSLLVGLRDENFQPLGPPSE
jgi:uncharacterized membrane-anchored protein